MKCPKCHHVFKAVQFIKGGKARWRGTTKKQRKQAASDAANARWAKTPNAPHKPCGTDDLLGTVNITE